MSSIVSRILLVFLNVCGFRLIIEIINNPPKDKILIWLLCFFLSMVVVINLSFVILSIKEIIKNE